jgi:hypothetical protein
MTNTSKRTVKLSTILRSAAFRDGYEAASKGIPFDPDAYKGESYHGLAAPYLYENGRYFAAYCRVELGRCITLKYGRTVSSEAMIEYRNALLSGAV